ncbi:MAG TPA: NADH-quinone oxidoreductase subunit NuoE [Thermoleophilia bacterium]|nr:NADH-quinone oxidoreductase subunit NuoE [Thermoleophilia bacterium]
MPRRVTRTPATVALPAGVDGPDLDRVGAITDDLDPNGNLIAVLQRLQQEFGYLPEPVIDELARLSGVPASRIYGVITFYAQFSTTPSGRHRVCVCHGTACHVAGAGRITEALEQELHVEDGGTTRDMEFTLDSVACMGACSQAPVMRVDDDTYGNLTADQTRTIVRELIAELGLEVHRPGGAPEPAAEGGGRS